MPLLHTLVVLLALAAPAPALVADSFDAPASASLNHALAKRQRGPLAPSVWMHRLGLWEGDPGGRSGASAIEALADGPGAQLVLRGNTAVRLARLLPLDPKRGLTVRLRVDPAVGDLKGLSWVSVTLTPDLESAAWVTAPEQWLGVLVRSNGAIQVFAGGQERPHTWVGAAPAAAASYAVMVQVQGSQIRGEVNGAAFEATLVASLDGAPQEVSLGLGAHFHPGDPQLTWIDDVAVAVP